MRRTGDGVAHGADELEEVDALDEAVRFDTDSVPRRVWRGTHRSVTEVLLGGWCELSGAGSGARLRWVHGGGRKSGRRQRGHLPRVIYAC